LKLDGFSVQEEMVNSYVRRTTILSAVALLMLSVGAQTQPKPEQAAQDAASSWLGLVDNGKYAESWKEAAELFRNAITSEKWQQSLHAARDPLGKLTSRKLVSATYTKTLPGVPDGDYVVIRYESSFEHKQSAIETVTPMLERDGKWRVSGYFIK
jgi:hypothetical protein